jgi:hypothetical protein
MGIIPLFALCKPLYLMCCKIEGSSTFSFKRMHYFKELFYDFLIVNQKLINSKAEIRDLNSNFVFYFNSNY